MRTSRLLALLVLASAGCSSDEGRPTDWNLVLVDTTTLELEAAVGSSSCQSLGEIATTSTDDYVEVLVNVVTSDDAMCTSDDVRETVVVELDRPLGDRELRGCRPDEPGGFPLDQGDAATPSDCRETTPALAPLSARFEVAVNYEYPSPTECPVSGVVLKDTSLGEPDRWEWQFPDGSTSAKQSPTVEPGRFPVATISEVTLTVWRGDETDSLTRDVEVVEC